MSTSSRIAICYDWFDTPHGGVERILDTLSELFPHADWHGIQKDNSRSAFARSHQIACSFIQRLPQVIRNRRALMLPLYPLAVESLDFRAYDLVISITSAFTKGIITTAQTRHITYLLTPPRYLYDRQTDYLTPFASALAQPILNTLRQTDYFQAQRPDRIVSISRHVQARCATYYKRDSDLIYPPFDDEYWSAIRKQAALTPPLRKPYFLIVNRLEPYKKTDAAIHACILAGYHPVVVGDGSCYRSLKRAYPTATFVKNVTDSELYCWYQHARGLIMIQEEELGLTALEAQFAGCPVLTYYQSGAAETILTGETGTLIQSQEPAKIAQQLIDFEIIADRMKKKTAAIGAQHVSDKFAKKHFMQTFLRVCSVS